MIISSVSSGSSYLTNTSNVNVSQLMSMLAQLEDQLAKLKSGGDSKSDAAEIQALEFQIQQINMEIEQASSSSEINDTQSDPNANAASSVHSAVNNQVAYKQNKTSNVNRIKKDSYKPVNFTA